MKTPFPAYGAKIFPQQGDKPLSANVPEKLPKLDEGLGACRT